MKMIRTLSLACAVAFAATADAKPISLSDLSAYLNGIKTAKADITQINADGTLSTGTLFLRRPGRARFEYDPPTGGLVMAGGGQVAVFDPKSNAAPDQFPLRRTPLNIILERNVNLGRRGMVVRHYEDGPTTNIVAQDPAHPEYGNIRLVFTGSPVELRQWVITDDSGSQTTVILGEMQKGVSIGARTFNIVQEIEARGLN